MIKNIAVTDTHRLMYPNGTLTAKKLGTTTNIKFYDGAGDELGEQIRLNAKGYFCDSNGNIYANGVFVKEDATITLAFPDGSSTSWTVKGEIPSEVNDGKLLDLNGNEVWSANSGNNYTLNYQDLANKPRINEWAECDQVLIIESDDYASNLVTVDKHTKSITINSSVPPNDGMALRVKITPEVATRWGQNIVVKNVSAYTMWLFNAVDDSVACLVRPGEYKMMTYNTDQHFHQGGDWEVKQYYGGQNGAGLNNIMDACRKWFININNYIHFTDLTANFNLYNTDITDFYLSWYPPLMSKNAPLTVSFTSVSLGQVVKVLKIRPGQTVHCVSFAGNSGLTIIGETEFSPKYQYADVDNGNLGITGKYSLPTVDDDVDVLVVNAKDMLSGAEGHEIPCDIYVNVSSTRTKPLRVMVTNVTFAYVFYRVAVYKGGIAQNFNYRSSTLQPVVSSKARTATDQEYKVFLEVRVDFLDINTMGTAALVCANWSGQVNQ